MQRLVGDRPRSLRVPENLDHVDRLRNVGEARKYAPTEQFLTAETGGFLTTATAKDLALRYEEIERDLREQYAVRYQITDASKPNQWRDVKVRVKPDNVIARTISGYFTP